MSKSLDFVINRIKTDQCIKVDEFKEACSCNFNNVIDLLSDGVKDLYKDNSMMLTLDGYYRGKKGHKTIIINYNPNTEYDYFTTESCICDGTYVFMSNLMIQIMYKLFQCQTYFKNSIPTDYENNFWDYDIVYNVGDFILNSFIDKSIAPRDKPWMCDKFTVMLPIKCEFKKDIKE